MMVVLLVTRAGRVGLQWAENTRAGFEALRIRINPPFLLPSFLPWVCFLPKLSLKGIKKACLYLFICLFCWPIYLSAYHFSYIMLIYLFVWALS